MDLVASSCDAMEPPFLPRDSTQSVWGKRASLPRRALPSGRAELFRHVRRQHLDQGCVDLGCSGDDVPAVAIIPAGERADAPAGFLDEELPRCRVPGTQSDLPERIDASGRDISQIECGRARAAYAGGNQGDIAQHAEVGVQVANVGAVGEAGGDQRALEQARLADAHAMVLKMRARPAAGG